MGINTLLGAIGFTKGGVVAGTFAAGMQAAAGNVAAGSMFAGLQSIAASGGAAVLGPVGIGLGAAGVAGYYAYNSVFGETDECNCCAKFDYKDIKTIAEGKCYSM